ncbi:MAG: archease [Phycisphaerae bacterium]
MEPSYELFDHTADMGIRVWAPTLPGLLIPAGEGLYTVIGDLVAGRESKPVTFDLTDDDPAVLLRDYLNELLILFDRDALRFTALDVAVFDEHRLAVTVQTAHLDGERSVFHREVKAITYHKLDIRTIPGGFEATLIVDI